MNTKEKGSEIAKNGFKNEDDIVEKFNNWKRDQEAKKWLTIMKYDISEIEYVRAVKISGHYKADIQVQVSIKLKKAIDVENLQVKLVSNLRGFNQIDKREVETYANMWPMPDYIISILKRYTGKEKPNIKHPLDPRRMNANEFSANEQQKILRWLKKNQVLIVSDILKGQGKFAAEWMLVAQRIGVNARWILKPMNYCINFFGNGDIQITPRGNFRIGRITMQRKGGDGGRESAKMLQFKINPAELFD
ncbi:MAG: hypothetical protein J6Y47_02795 [Bacteroidales bacterium]|nr:hypothetical protein [Bacteroidales bacterium]